MFRIIRNWFTLSESKKRWLSKNFICSHRGHIGGHWVSNGFSKTNDLLYQQKCKKCNRFFGAKDTLKKLRKRYNIRFK